MPYPVRPAAARRDMSLLRLRKLSLWIASAAAGTAVSLGIVFAHALPGHAGVSGQRAGFTGSGGGFAGSGGGFAGSGPGKSGTVQPSPSAAPGPGHRHHRRHLAAPRQAPARSSAPPVVSSGGS